MLLDWLLDPRRIRVIDAAVLAWVLAWALLGYASAQSLRELTRVTDSVASVGGSVVQAGDAIGSLGDTPIIGGAVGDAGESVAGAGREAQAQAGESRGSVEMAALGLGLAVWLVPSLPLLALYGPMRLLRTRDARALRALVAEHGDDGELDRLLAARALAHLPYPRLRALGTPWRDFEAGEYRRLAELELARSGVRRS